MKIGGNAFLLSLLRRYYGDAEEHPIRRAVLEGTYFIHPDVVAQAGALPILRARRVVPSVGERKNTIVDGVFVSDNFPPDYVFRAAMADSRDQGSTHLCHIYGGNGEARDTYFYSNLANLCLVPSFLAKLADTDQAIVTLLKECAFLLFGFDPDGGMSRRAIPANLRCQIRTAAPPGKTLFDELLAKRNANFLVAKTAGFVFSTEGEINVEDPWVSEMIARRGRIQPPPRPS